MLELFTFLNCGLWYFWVKDGSVHSLHFQNTDLWIWKGYEHLQILLLWNYIWMLMFPDLD